MQVTMMKPVIFWHFSWEIPHFSLTTGVMALTFRCNGYEKPLEIKRKIIMAKAKPAPKAAAKPAKSTKSSKALTKSEIYAELAEAASITKAQVKAVFETLLAMIVKQLTKKGVAKMTLPGLVRLKTTMTKEIKKGTMVRNPFTGEEKASEGKPAQLKVKSFPVKALTEAVRGGG
jgi:nucleoid DNA-binding protein